MFNVNVNAQKVVHTSFEKVANSTDLSLSPQLIAPAQTTRLLQFNPKRTFFMKVANFENLSSSCRPGPQDLTGLISHWVWAWPRPRWVWAWPKPRWVWAWSRLRWVSWRSPGPRFSLGAWPRA